MTAEEWDSCTSIEKMLLVTTKGWNGTGTGWEPPAVVTARKLRLIACASWRLARPSRTANSSLYRAIELAERVADGDMAALEDSRHTVLHHDPYNACMCIVNATFRTYWGQTTEERLCHVVRDIVYNPQMEPIYLRWVKETTTNKNKRWRTSTPEQVSWLTPQVIEFATSIYQETTYDNEMLLALSDMIEELGGGGEKCPSCNGAGGESMDSGGFTPWGEPIDNCYVCAECMGNDILPSRILQHLRNSKPHYRGCWAVDSILGKS